MSRLYLRLPSNTAAESVPSARGLVCTYALVTAGKVAHEGVAALSELSATLAKVDGVTLLLAASDVTLLRVRVPPLSQARLNAALPNLVEEHLISDPSECTLVAGASVDGLRTIAVVQRAWLETIARTLAAESVQSMVAVPAQLCLPLHAGAASAIVDPRADEVAVTVRLSAQEGIGIALPGSSSARDVLEALGAVARDAPLVLYVPEAQVAAYRGALDAIPDLARRVTLEREDWTCWLDGAESVGLNLFAGLKVRDGGQDRWRHWRWPMALAAGLVAVNVLGLHADWWRMRSEADRLRSGMVQTFRSAYPKETVILDPAAQMKQKIAASRRAAGQLAPDDFLTLVSGFADAWTGAAQRAPGRAAPRIAAVEYRDRSLAVRIEGDSDAADERLAAALKARGLAFSQPTAGTWQIRSTK